MFKYLIRNIILIIAMPFILIFIFFGLVVDSSVNILEWAVKGEWCPEYWITHKFLQAFIFALK